MLLSNYCCTPMSRARELVMKEDPKELAEGTCNYKWPKDPAGASYEDLCPVGWSGSHVRSMSHHCVETVMVETSQVHNDSACIAACKQHQCRYCGTTP